MLRHILTLISYHLASTFLVKNTLKPTRLYVTRWFVMHVFVNVEVAYRTFTSLHWNFSRSGKCLITPAPFPEASMFPIQITLLLHLWHMVFFKLSRADWFHHMIFVTLLGVPGAVWFWGSCGNAFLFFTCGLPGAIIYTILAAQNCGALTFVNEVSVSAFVNLFFRMPGALWAQWELYTAWTNYGRLPLLNKPPSIFVYIQLFLGVSNGIYYSYLSLRRLYTP